MISEHPKKLSVWLQDILTFAPTEYCLLVRQDSLALLRVGRRDEVQMLFNCEYADSDDGNALNGAIGTMRNSGAYYGQPVSVVIVGSGYSYIKRTDDSEFTKLSDRVRFLQSDEHDLRNQLIEQKSGKLFITQAVEKAQLAQIVAASDLANLNVTRISTLSAILVGNRLKRQKMAAIDLVHFPTGEASYLIEDGRDSILFNTLPRRLMQTELATAAGQIRDKFFDSGREVDVRIYSRPTDGNSDSSFHTLGNLLGRGIGGVRKLKGLTYATGRSKLAVGLKTALNAARLLLMVFGSALVVSAMVAGVTGAMAPSDNEDIVDFQNEYNTRLTLERKRESLLDQEQDMMSQRPGNRHSAAVISAFCQRTFSSISLNRINLSTAAAGDSTHIEMSGSASGENAIFRYFDVTSQYVSPYRLTMSSIKPQVRNHRGKSDTTLTFKFTMVVDDKGL